jgi:hypothetical protein
VSDPAQALRAFEGADVVYQCAAPRYSQWPAQLPALMRGAIEGAAAAGARIVYGDNLYAYGRVSGPITEDLPARPVGPNGRTRAAVAELLLKAHADAKLRAVIGRGSILRSSRDGLNRRRPRRTNAGRRVAWCWRPTAPHRDLHRRLALITLGSHDESFGRSGMSPPPKRNHSPVRADRRVVPSWARPRAPFSCS